MPNFYNRIRRVCGTALLASALLVGGVAASCNPDPACTRTISPGTTIGGIAGEVVCLRGGTYAQHVTIRNSNFTVRAVQGEIAIIDGATLGLGPHDGLFDINAGVHGFRLAHVVIQNSGGRGIQNDGDHNFFDHNLIRRTGNAAIITTGYFGNAQYNTYTDNEIDHAVQLNDPTHPCNCWESSINNYDGVGPVGHNTYARNYVHDSNGEGHTYVDYDTDTGSRYARNGGGPNFLGVYLDGAQHVTIDGVTTDGVMLADENSPGRNSDNVVKNSDISDSLGLRFWNAGSSGTGLKNDVFENNKLRSGIDFDSGNHSNTVVRNNEVWGTVRGLTQPGITQSGNLFH